MSSIPAKDPARTSDHQVLGHEMTVYSSESFLRSSVTEFLAPALQGEGAVVIVASAVHAAMLETALAERGIDLSRARRAGRLLVVDAAETLAEVRIGGAIDDARLRPLLEEVLDQAGTATREVRVYGEIVSLLWAEGDVAGAMQVEGLWEGLRRQRPFLLHCGYHVADIDRAEGAGELADIRACHDRTYDEAAVEPAAVSDTDEGGDARLCLDVPVRREPGGYRAWVPGPQGQVVSTVAREWVRLLPAVRALVAALYDRSEDALDPRLRLDSSTRRPSDAGVTQARAAAPETLHDRLVGAPGSGGADTPASSWPARIRRALDEGQLVLHAQPIVDLASGRTVQHELLIRLDDPTEGLILPGRFLPAAETHDLAPLIDRWVLDQATTLLRAGHGVQVNLSARSFVDTALPTAIERLLATSDAAPGQLVLELTETALLEDGPAAARLAERLRRMGCGLALDDFGTGYCALTNLKRLQPDALKIDLEFVRDATSDAASRRIIEAVVALASTFGIYTIAEGVEDRATLELLGELGVDQAQGYYLGRPAPLHRTPLGQVMSSASSAPDLRSAG